MLSYSITSILLFSILIGSSGVLGSFHHHYAPAYQRRQEQAPVTYTLFTPSPGASPIPVTKQSQVLTSYIAQSTVCASAVDPALTSVHASMSVSAVLYTPPASTAKPSSGRFRPRPANGTGFYPVTSTTSTATLNRRAAGDTSCSTAYKPEITTVCATTLQGIGSAITITDCDQAIVFSTDVSFNVVVPSDYCEPSRMGQLQPAATTTTLYLAHWGALTDGQIPDDVTARVCSGGTCSDAPQTLSTTRVTRTSTSTTTIFTTVTLPGSSNLPFANYHASIAIPSGTHVAAQLAEGTMAETSTQSSLNMSVEALSTSTTHVRSTITETVTLYPSSTVTGASVLATLVPASSSSDASSSSAFAATSAPSSSSSCSSALSNLAHYVPPSQLAAVSSASTMSSPSGTSSTATSSISM